MPRPLGTRMSTLAALLGAFCAASMSFAQSFSDDFDGPAATTMTLESNNDLNALPSAVLFDDTGDSLGIEIIDPDTASASVAIPVDGNFRVAATISVIDADGGDIDFTAGSLAVFAYAGFGPGLAEGIELRLTETAFDAVSYQLQLRNGGTLLASSAIFDLTSPAFDDAGTFSLELIGVIGQSGDVDLTGTLTPDPATTLGASGPVVIQATLPAASFDPIPDLFGFRQSIFGSNDLTARWDDFSATTAFMPPVSITRVEDSFDGGTTALTFESRDNPTTDPDESVFTLINDGLDILITNDDAAAAFVSLDGDDDFVVRADVSPTLVDFTAGTLGVFAYSPSGPLPGDGIELHVQNVGFTQDEFALKIVDGGSTIAESPPFDIGFFGDQTSFSLELRGDVAPDGSVALTGSLTPDPTDNSIGLAPQSVAATIPGFSPAGQLFGIRQTIFGGNPIEATYDNFLAQIEPFALDVLYREVFPNDTGTARALGVVNSDPGDPLSGNTGWEWYVEDGLSGVPFNAGVLDTLPIIPSSPGLASGLEPVNSDPISPGAVNGFVDNFIDGFNFQQIFWTNEFEIDRTAASDVTLRWQQSGGSELQAVVQVGGAFYISESAFPGAGPTQTVELPLDSTQWIELFFSPGAFIFPNATAVDLPDGIINGFGFYLASRTADLADNFAVDNYEVLGTSLVPVAGDVLYREIFEPDLSNDPTLETADFVGWSVIGSDPNGMVPDLVAEIGVFLTCISAGASVPDAPAINSFPLGIQTAQGVFTHFFTGGVWDLAQLITTAEFAIAQADFTPSAIRWRQQNGSLVGGGVAFRGAVQIGAEWYISSDEFSNTVVDTFQARGVSLVGTLWHPLAVELGDEMLMETGVLAPDFATTVELPAGDLNAFGVWIDDKPNFFEIDTFEVLGVAVICLGDFNDDNVIDILDVQDFLAALGLDPEAAAYAEPAATGDAFDIFALLNALTEPCPGIPAP